jgi:hypothetical protein
VLVNVTGANTVLIWILKQEIVRKTENLHLLVNSEKPNSHLLSAYAPKKKTKKDKILWYHEN